MTSSLKKQPWLGRLGLIFLHLLTNLYYSVLQGPNPAWKIPPPPPPPPAPPHYNFHVVTQFNFSYSLCSCTIFILTSLFVDTGYANFDFNWCSIFTECCFWLWKGSNAQNHSSSDSHFPAPLQKTPPYPFMLFI